MTVPGFVGGARRATRARGAALHSPPSAMAPASADPTSTADGGAAPAERPARARRAALLCAAFGVWAWSVFAHGYGTDLASGFFQWSKVPGNLDERGGEQGVRVAETLLRALFVVAACADAALAIPTSDASTC
jgi:hypothetical protein